MGNLDNLEKASNKSVRCTTLMYACQQGDYQRVAKLLRINPSLVREKDRTQKNALHYCAEAKTAQCADLVLTAAPDLINVADEDGLTPLHLAVISGNVAMTHFLLAHKGDVFALDNEKHSVVHWATVCGETTSLQAVLLAGASVNTPDVHGGYPLHYAAQMCGVKDSFGIERLETCKDASKLGFEVLQVLLSHPEIRVDVEDVEGRQPLLWASSAGSSQALLALVAAGGAPEAYDHDGLTALHCAASRGHTDCIEALLTMCGVSPDVIDTNGCTALHYAVTLGHADATALLLAHGAKVNRQDRKGRTPAHCACAKGQVETVRILEGHGADMWMKSARGDLPLHDAVSSGRRQLVRWLLSLKPSMVNASNNDGRTALHIAAINNYTELCKVLLDNGANVNAVLRSARNVLMTSLDCALRNNHRSTAKYLQLNGGLPFEKLRLRHTMSYQSNGPFYYQNSYSHSDSESEMMLHRMKRKVFRHKRRLMGAVEEGQQQSDVMNRRNDSSKSFNSLKFDGDNAVKKKEMKLCSKEIQTDERTIFASAPDRLDLDYDRKRLDDIASVDTISDNTLSAMQITEVVLVHVQPSFSDERGAIIEEIVEINDCVGDENNPNDTINEVKTISGENKEIQDFVNVVVTNISPLETPVDEMNGTINVEESKAKENTEGQDRENPKDDRKQSILDEHLSDKENIKKIDDEGKRNETIQVETQKGNKVIDETSDVVDEKVIAGTDDIIKEIVVGDIINEPEVAKILGDVENNEHDSCNQNKVEQINEISGNARENNENLIKNEQHINSKNMQQIEKGESFEQGKSKNEETILSDDSTKSFKSFQVLNNYDLSKNCDENSKTTNANNDFEHHKKLKNTNQLSTQNDIQENSKNNQQEKPDAKIETEKIKKNEKSTRLDRTHTNKNSNEPIPRKSTSKPKLSQKSFPQDTVRSDKTRVKKCNSMTNVGESENCENIETRKLIKKVTKSEKLCNAKDPVRSVSTLDMIRYSSDSDSFINVNVARHRKKSLKKRKSKSQANLRASDDDSDLISSKHRCKRNNYASDSQLLDSGIEPSPRSSRIPQRKRHKSPANVTTVTQAVQSNIRRYHLERKVFQHLLELKRLQIRSGQANEAVLVKRAIDAYHSSILTTVGAGRYTTNDYTYKSFEKFLYESLRRLQSSHVKYLEQLPSSPPHAALQCTHTTMKCDHALNAYTSLPSATYELQKLYPKPPYFIPAPPTSPTNSQNIAKTFNVTSVHVPHHHTMPKAMSSKRYSGFLPKINIERNIDSLKKSAVTLELRHGNDTQVITLPADRMDHSKKYYVTFTVNDNQDAKGHRHAKSC